MYPQNINPLEMVEVADDFTHLDTLKWATVDDGGTGTNLIVAAAGGQASVLTAAAANDYHFMVSPSKLFLLAAKKPIWFAARFKAGTSAGMQYLGLSSDIAATLVTDTTGVLVNTFSGGVFYCLPASLALGFKSSNATVQTAAATLCTMVAGQWYQAGFHWDSGDGTTSYITPWVYDETAAARYIGTPHAVAVASLAQMGVLYGVKSAGAAETFTLDYIRCAQKR